MVTKVVVNRVSKQPGNSAVRLGLTENDGQEVRIDEETTLHHVATSLVGKEVV